MDTKKFPDKELMSEIFGKDEAKRISVLESSGKSGKIIALYLRSMIELVKQDSKDKNGVKLLEELYNSEKSIAPNFLVLIACENNETAKKAMMRYALSPIIQEITFLEDEDKTIDTFKSKIDYESFSDDKKLREKCEKVMSKHFLVLTTVIDKMISGDREGLVKIMDNVMKKYKNVDNEYRDTHSNQTLNSDQIIGNKPDENGFSEFLKNLM